ncbi:MAG: hypothetical protein KIS78_07890 [Labilithrix sp.]|nr:hypothetical protein [Labilithrix sp.]
MRFPVMFVRRKGGSGSTPLLGVDAKPIASTPKGTGPGDNVLSHKLARPMNRVAVGYRYEGAGSAVALPVSIWCWDDASEKWFEADAGTLQDGALTYLKCPALADPPPTSANLGQPQHGVDVLVIVEDDGAPDGTYRFVAGPDTANWSGT